MQDNERDINLDMTRDGRHSYGIRHFLCHHRRCTFFVPTFPLVSKRANTVRPLTLMDLPAELRFLIFEFVLSHSTNKLLNLIADGRHTCPKRLPPITEVSKAIRAESL